MINHKIYNRITKVPQDWDTLVAHDILLNTQYLKALEDASPSNIKLYYLGVFNNNELIGVAIIQHVQLYLKDMFRATKASCFKDFLKQNISKVLKGNVLVLGNLTHTGQHAFFFKNINIREFYTQVFKGISELKVLIKKEKGKTIRVVVTKDFFIGDKMLNNDFLLQQKLHKVVVQPNMTMLVRQSWNNNEDYVTAMHKKYRTRFKRAKKKLNGIVCKEMDIEAIKANSLTLHNMYLNVSKNAKFNTFILPKNHFYTFKKTLKENFKVFGYYLDDKLVGFFTLILNSDYLETYFLGYDTAHQYKNQLYLNMLYDMANFGIEQQFKEIVYARTAMEIKSSVGAKPKEMFIYLKHTNRVFNAILKQIFKLMNPSQDWIERHPFKE